MLFFSVVIDNVRDSFWPQREREIDMVWDIGLTEMCATGQEALSVETSVEEQQGTDGKTDFRERWKEEQENAGGGGPASTIVSASNLTAHANARSTIPIPSAV